MVTLTLLLSFQALDSYSDAERNVRGQDGQPAFRPVFFYLSGPVVAVLSLLGRSLSSFAKTSPRVRLGNFISLVRLSDSAVQAQYQRGR